MAFPTWLVGVTLAFLGSVLSNLGVNLQKLSHDKVSAKAKEDPPLEFSQLNPLGTRSDTVVDQSSPIEASRPVKAPNPCTQPLWVIGLLCIAIGSVMDLVSFAFAPLSLLAPLGAMVRASKRPFEVTQRHACRVRRMGLSHTSLLL